MGRSARGLRGWWRRLHGGAARGVTAARAHAEAQWRLLPGRYRPWRRVVQDGVVVAERRRADGSVADRLPWGAYCVLRRRHRRLADGARAFVRRNRWRWLRRMLVGW